MPEFEQILLSTQRLILRPLRETDAQAVFALRSNPAAMRYHSSLPWTSTKKAVEFILKCTTDMKSNANIRLGIERTEDNTLIGTCTLFQIDAQCRRAEIGYELNQAVWGKGYMDEALRALLHFAFTDLNLNRVEADVHPDNINSCKSLERLGFKKEGQLRERWIVGDEVSDSVIFGLLLSEWRAQH